MSENLKETIQENGVEQPHIHERHQPYTTGKRVAFQVDAQMIFGA